jgi:hypothetical protein
MDMVTHILNVEVVLCSDGDNYRYGLGGDDGTPVMGTKGVPAATNSPGSRYSNAMAYYNANIYMFGNTPTQSLHMAHAWPLLQLEHPYINISPIGSSFNMWLHAA